jgi:hypothetical protein
VGVWYGYPSGGAGYVLSNQALSRIGSSLRTNNKFCKITRSGEDLDVAICLRKLQVYPNKSIDDEGRERFHPLSLTSHFDGSQGTAWLNSSALNPVQFVRKVTMKHS